MTTARHERDALGRTCQYTPMERWEEPSPRKGKRVKDVLAHLAASDVAAAALVAGEEATEVEEFRKSLDGEEFTADAWHDWAVEKSKDDTSVSLAREWGRAADLLLARVGEASDEDWHEREIPWIAGDIRLKYFVQARVAEWWVHGEDIREGGRLPPRREHWPIYAVNDLAIRLIPYTLAQAGLEFGEKSVQIDLDGVGEESWHQPAVPGDLPAGKKPDAYILGEGYAFASVAGGRADPDICLYEGLLNTGGEVEVAEAVLHTLRSWP
jgi:uncharacterized protein (TIGR03083 family)